jgi:hypothetical protein
VTEPTTALAPVSASTDLDAPIPRYGGAAMVQAFEAYRSLQAELDRAMPDQIMAIGDRDFRKKGYWRAVSVAFDLTIELAEERREVWGAFDDGRENFGYLVTYRASTPRRTVTGDGACFAVEKAAKFRCPHEVEGRPGYTQHYPSHRCPDFDPDFRWHTLPDEASEHNVRSHAHTRAFNRAISNLVGFGEVSAEEIERDEAGDSARRSAPGPAEPRPAGRGATTSAGREPFKISQPQIGRLWGIAKRANWTEPEVHTHIARYGFEHVGDITRTKYDAICAELERGVDGTR